MQENIYDSERFFEQYSRFPRSVEGLNAAGEWHELQRMLPDFTGKRVLDVGCGFGWHCIYAAENGAQYVLGTDISEKMLAVAKEKTVFANVEYRKLAMEEMDFPPNSFDIVISSLALHYTPDFALICDRVHRCLRPGGAFVFSAEHPVFTAFGTQDWFAGENGERLHWPVDRYFAEGRRDAVFLGESVVKYHKTLTTYLRSLLKAGFAIADIVEPQPAELRRPMMLLVSAQKRCEHNL